MSVSNYPEFFKIKSDVFLFSYFPFLFQLKSKHDYYNDDSIRLLMTFESGLEACNFINSYAGISWRLVTLLTHTQVFPVKCAKILRTS